MHMREAIDKLMADFNKFLEENAVFKGEGAASLNDMKDMLASLPQYQEQREKVCIHFKDEWNTYALQFSLHLSMAQDCMAIFERDKLPVAAAVEQVSVCTPSSSSDQGCVELRDRVDGRGKDAKASGRGDGPFAGFKRNHASNLVWRMITTHSLPATSTRSAS